jgi:hypothetical protein
MGPARGAIGELPRRIFSPGAESPAAVDRKFLATVIDRRSIGPGERLRPLTKVRIILIRSNSLKPLGKLRLVAWSNARRR